MATVIEPNTFSIYQNKVKELTSKNNTTELLKHIDEYRIKYAEGAELEAFFKGELAFYSENYEKALVYYMQARTIEDFEFYCYRATAFVSFLRNNFEKALSFIEKALQMKPEDQKTLCLKHDLLIKQGEHDQAETVKPRLDSPEETAAVEEPPSQETDAIPEPKKQPPEPSSDFIATKLGVDVKAEEELEKKILAHKKASQSVIQNYIESGSHPSSIEDNTLWVLSGWNQPKPCDIILDMPAKYGGCFIRWNGHGVVINPGQFFLERFHQAGLHLQMIDSVIITEPHQESFADVQKIYDLNYDLNKLSSELHIIHYYLHHHAHQLLAHTLKPNFKQERSTVHNLELFLDSPDIEKENLSDEITLNYFSSGSRSSISGNQKPHALAIWLDLTDGAEVKKIGFVSATGWSTTLAAHFGSINVMVSGFGSTNPNDYGKLNYTEENLGYFGTYSLLEEVKPTLHLVAGFDGKQGDIRLEILKKLRKEYAKNRLETPDAPIVLPADKGLKVDLNQMKIFSSITNERLDPKHVRICKTEDAFGRLSYFSQDSIL